ncbi:MAG: hypothetical protein QM730_24625 [Anaerolineales bacterium]
MNTNITIRNATAEDAAVIVKLIRQLGADSEVSEAYVLEYLSGTERAVLLAQHKETVIGLAQLFLACGPVPWREFGVDR